MDGKALARLAAVVFVAVAITAAAIELTRKDTPPADHNFGLTSAMPSNPLRRDPLRAELKRCQLIGEAGRSDPTCLRAWAESRERFLGQSEHIATTPDVPSSPNSNEAR